MSCHVKRDNERGATANDVQTCLTARHTGNPVLRSTCTCRTEPRRLTTRAADGWTRADFPRRISRSAFPLGRHLSVQPRLTQTVRRLTQLPFQVNRACFHRAVTAPFTAQYSSIEHISTIQMDTKLLHTIDWSSYRTAYGVAATVPDQLRRLASTNRDDAMQASHDLWCGLCHQHAYVSSAALPALPFLLEVLRTANDALTVEILDIILGFAVCTSPVQRCHLPLWTQELRTQLKEAFPQFEHLRHHTNTEIADFADSVRQYLEE
jgi:hypothetical protein